MNLLNSFSDEISKANAVFIENLRREYPDLVAKAAKIFGEGPTGWIHKIYGQARGLWERQDPCYATKEEFEAFVAGEFELTLKDLERQGMPPQLIDAIFELGRIHTDIGSKYNIYEGYGHLRREHG